MTNHYTGNIFMIEGENDNGALIGRCVFLGHKPCDVYVGEYSDMWSSLLVEVDGSEIDKYLYKIYDNL